MELTKENVRDIAVANWCTTKRYKKWDAALSYACLVVLVWLLAWVAAVGYMSSKIGYSYEYQIVDTGVLTMDSEGVKLNGAMLEPAKAPDKNDIRTMMTIGAAPFAVFMVITIVSGLYVMWKLRSEYVSKYVEAWLESGKTKLPEIDY